MNTAYSPPNILVVDDVNANLALLTEIIHNAGYIARPVTSARQAVNAIEALTPNLILLDISMPEIDGFVFCSMLKKNAKTRGIPVIFISAMNTAEDKIKGFESGAADFIAKPFDAEELILRIGMHLKMNKIQQELETYNKKLSKVIEDQIEKIYEEQKHLINALAKLYVKTDNLAEIHQENIGKNSRLLAICLQISPKYKNHITNSYIDAIEITSKLHDIGKIAINGNTHTVIGSEILEEIYSQNKNNELLKMAIEIARYHHENWDGTGYPEGLKGTDIPLHARIVAITDTYEGLVSETDSKTTHTHEESMKLINDGAGIYFDPDIIAVFNKIQNQLVK